MYLSKPPGKSRPSCSPPSTQQHCLPPCRHLRFEPEGLRYHKFCFKIQKKKNIPIFRIQKKKWSIICLIFIYLFIWFLMYSPKIRWENTEIQSLYFQACSPQFATLFSAWQILLFVFTHWFFIFMGQINPIS